MKLTNSTLKQYIKHVLAEQKLLTEARCTDEAKDWRTATLAGIRADTRKAKRAYYNCKYPMKLAKDPQAQKKERFEINAACFGWKRKPAKEGDLGRPNRIFGKVYRDAKKSGQCPEPSKMPFADWKKARRCNWRGKTECVAKILNRLSKEGSKCTYSKNWSKGFRPMKWEIDERYTRLAVKSCLYAVKNGRDPTKEAMTGYATQSIGMEMSAGHTQAKIFCSDVLCAKGLLPGTAEAPAGVEAGAATAAGPCGKGTTPPAALRQVAQHLHDDMQGGGSANTVKTMIRHQQDLIALSAAFDLVTTPGEKKKYGDLAQWLIDEIGCRRCQQWGKKVRQCVPVPDWCTACKGYTPPQYKGTGGEETVSSGGVEKEILMRPEERMKFPKGGAFAVTEESKVFSSFPEQQKLTEGWKKYLDTE